MGMKMPEVTECSVENCAYNHGMECHALAITVGEPGGQPACDTFFATTKYGGDADTTAGVGACKLAECEYNCNFECAAGHISVGIIGDHPDCLTFCPR